MRPVSLSTLNRILGPRHNFLIRFSIFVMLFVASFGSRSYADLIVAVDIGRDDQAVEIGFTGYSTVGGPNDIDLFVPQSFLGGTWDLEGTQGVTTRNYGDIETSPLGDLLEDSVLMNASPTVGYIELVLDDLAPGDYQLTTYHHSFANGGATAQLFGGLEGETPVFLQSVASSTGTDISSFSSFTVDFSTTASVDGYTLRFDPVNAAGSFHFDFSGFELTGPPIPEPSTLTFVVIGGLASLISRRRRSASSKRHMC